MNNHPDTPLAPASAPNRVFFIDWLRIGTMFILVFYHTGRLFDLEPWHLKNAVLNTAINVFNRFLDIWMMPLFFMLAGISVWFALGHRTPGAFSKERLLRLLVPFFFGMLIIVPPQVYTQRIFDGDFSGSYWSWYPHFFSGTYSMDDPTTGNLTFSYLWFLIYLWVFSMILMPLFFYFRKESRKSLLSRLAGFMEKPGAIFLPAVPLIIINILLRPKYGWGNQNLIDDWANFLFYMLIVLYGFLIVSDSRNIQTTRRNSYPALGVAAICTLFIALNRLDIVGVPTPLNMTLYAVACWSWLIFIISIGSRLLNFTNPVRSYANDAVLPVYILHQSIIVILAYFITQWNTPVLLKYFLIGFTTLVSSLAIYEVVRRINVTRFLFGIKTRKKALGS